VRIGSSDREGAQEGSRPSPLSSAKEIIGHHGHKSHGKSIRWPALYEHLLKKGYSKQKAAMISNGQWRKKHGLPPASARGVVGLAKGNPDGKDLNVPRPVRMSKKQCKSKLAKRRPDRWNP
jgi:hypothetical protein